MRNAPEGIRDGETRIIGLELRVRTDPRTRFEEMEIFSCKYTLRDNRPGGYNTWEGPEVQITVHTSNGDLTLQGMLPQ